MQPGATQGTADPRQQSCKLWIVHIECEYDARMRGGRVQRRIDSLLDEAEAAITERNWTLVQERCEAVLALDTDNADARAYREAAARAMNPAAASRGMPPESPSSGSPIPGQSESWPRAFANGRYQVRRFLGEGGKKRVFAVHDRFLDRDAAVALIRTEGLNSVGRQRILREAQAMARLGSHPGIVSIFDIGEHHGTPFVVTELMRGGDVEAMLDDAGGPLPLERTLEIAKGVAGGLAFAHERQVVHRDLKPGNVWLTEEGIPRIGDFGLALSLDRTRITQQGMIVGTVAYMPPEQALGGEATQHSDLYSLGAMLYEMVTGRPPFQGSDPTAMISQHVNTAPVAPLRLAGQCTPDLEDLILQLLEKDPGKRPASAGDVVERLEEVNPVASPADQPCSNHPALGRLDRGVFVGREAELQRLRSAFDQAFAGHGSVVLLAGEPGIGKTRTAEELQGYARLRGAFVFWGRSHESPGAPPYWPWLQVGRQWGSEHAAEAIGATLGPLSSDLVGLFPELRQLPGFVEPESVTGPEAAQFRLFEAFVAFLKSASHDRTFVIVLDDLHWADKATLLLFQHVARNVASMRVLLIGTYRDIELDAGHPLATILADLNRLPGFERITLPALSDREMADYIEAIDTGSTPGQDVATRIFAATEGNPFFLGEVVRLLVKEGALSATSPSDVTVPEGVREVLERRLRQLSEAAHERLRIAAVIGREFTVDTLALVTGDADAHLLSLLEESIAAHVIEEPSRPGRFRFTHALMHETVLAELSATRKARLHGAVAEALETRSGDRAEEYASYLAWHFGESAALTPGHVQKHKRYALIAARQAEFNAAWADVVRWYEAVIAGEDDPDPQILATLSNYYIYASDAYDPRVAETFRRAVAGFRRRGDGPGLARAVAQHRVIADDGFYRDALAHRTSIEPALRAQLLARAIFTFGFSNARPELVPSLEDELLALPAEDPSPNVEAFRLDGLAHRANRLWDVHNGALLYHQAAQEHERLGSHSAAIAQQLRATCTALCAGDLSHAAEHLAVLEDRSLEYRDGQGLAMTAMCGASLALLRWDLAGVERYTRGERSRTDSRGNGTVDQGITWRRRLLQEGPSESLVRSIPPRQKGLGMGPWEEMAFAAAASEYQWWNGNMEAAAEEFDLFLSIWRTGAGHIFERVEPFSRAWWYLVQEGDKQVQLEIYDEVRRWKKNWCGPWSGVGIDACRAHLAMELGLCDEAEQAFRDGVGWAEREGAPVALGRNLQGLAAVAEDRGDVAAALGYLDRAAAEYLPRGIKLYLDQVVEAKVRLQGLTGVGPKTAITPPASAEPDSDPQEVASAHPAEATAPPPTGDLRRDLQIAAFTGLSSRELEVLRLVASGKRNHEIAAELVISPATVTRHVSNIFDKTGLSNRTQLAIYALHRGLLEH